MESPNRLADWDVITFSDESGEPCRMVMMLMDGDTEREYLITPQQARGLAQTLINAEFDWAVLQTERGAK